MALKIGALILASCQLLGASVVDAYHSHYPYNYKLAKQQAY